MHKVISKDGTPIAYDKFGKGPAVILVGGALSDRAAGAPLAALLAPDFTVFTIDRRGRGDSGDTPPYAVEREVEDINALIAAAGGSAFVMGNSSGAVLALEAAARGLAIKKLAMFEPPFIVDDTRPPVPQDYVQHINELIAAGRRGDAVQYFMIEAVSAPAEIVAQMRNTPMWSALEKIAHTLTYDGTVMGDSMRGKPLSPEHWATVTMPTLVIDGGDSPTWMRHSAQSLANILPNAQYRTLAGQTHNANPKVLAPVLIEFFSTQNHSLNREAASR